MTRIDWITVSFWVVGTSAFGLYFKRYVKSTRDYLLAGRRLRWWQIAMAQSADAVDATDFVAVTGKGAGAGVSQIGFAWWGMGIGSILLSRYIAPLLYRTGVYTNAEYLELRFTRSLRIASAVLQALYRFVAMALVVYAMATMFQVILGISLWRGIWVAMGLTLVYVFTSGQLGVVMAAIPQVLLMLATAIVIFVSATLEVGGLGGLPGEKPGSADRLLHLAGHVDEGIPGGVYLWGMILTLVAYPIVNQTVAQRIVSARSEADARKGTIASLLPWCVITGASVMVGIMAVALVPDVIRANPDHVFPELMMRYLPPGFLGLGVAALVVASMSTGAGIGTAVAGLIVVDVAGSFRHGRLRDEHRLLITRLFATLSIVVGTLFAMAIPWFKSMIDFYVALTGTFFLPLVVPYVGGALYPKASRGSGIAALAGGIGAGSLLFLGNELEWLPVVLSHPQWRPFWVLAFTSILFVLWSVLENRRRGPSALGELAGALNVFDLGKEADSEEVQAMIQRRSIASWEGKENLDFGALGISKRIPWHAHPSTYEILALILLVVLMIWWW